MENRIRQWDFVFLRQSFQTSEGVVPKNTEARVLELYGEKKCKVLFLAPRFHKDVVPREILEFKSSHWNHTNRMLAQERPPVPLFNNIPDVCYA